MTCLFHSSPLTVAGPRRICTGFPWNTRSPALYGSEEKPVKDQGWCGLKNSIRTQEPTAEVTSSGVLLRPKRPAVAGNRTHFRDRRVRRTPHGSTLRFPLPGRSRSSPVAPSTIRAAHRLKRRETRDLRAGREDVTPQCETGLGCRQAEAGFAAQRVSRIQ